MAVSQGRAFAGAMRFTWLEMAKVTRMGVYVGGGREGEGE